MLRRLSTVCQSEIDKFSKVSKEWWNVNSAMGTGPLHQINPIRVQFIKRNVGKALGQKNDTRPFAGLSMVDVGCGGGLLAEALQRLGGQVTGLDPSEENIGIAKWHAAQDHRTNGIEYLAVSSDEYLKEKRQFDVVCSLEVVEHVQDMQLFVDNVVGLAKPGGLIFMSTLNKTWLSYMLGIVAIEDVFQMVPKGTHEWEKFVSPEDLSLALEKNHATVMEVNGICGDPISKSWSLSEKNTQVNYILCARKID